MTKTYNVRGIVIRHYSPLERLKRALKTAYKQHKLNQIDFMA